MTAQWGWSDAAPSRIFIFGRKLLGKRRLKMETVNIHQQMVMMIPTKPDAERSA
jgi:hypothetical protein